MPTVDGQQVFSMFVFFIFSSGRSVLGGFKGLCGWSWAALSASVGGPEPLSGPVWAVLASFEAFVGGPGLS